MARALRGMIGRGMARTAGQVAMSVLATLIATQLYGVLRRGAHDVEAELAAPPPVLTSGGKYEARSDGAALPPLPEPARPVISVVNWAFAAPSQGGVVTDPGSLFLRGADSAGVDGAAESRAARRVQARRLALVTRTLPVHQPQAGPAAPVPAPEAVRPDMPSRLVDATRTAVGTAAHTVLAFSGAAVAAGGGLVKTLAPWSR